MALILVPALCVAVSGLVGTVKLPVYTATPLTNLKLLILPGHGSDPLLFAPTVNILAV
jgi:hypothetical protein